MLTHRHNDNGGGAAATDPPCAPRRIRGPHLQPQGSLTRSLPRRPTAALAPGDLDDPQSAHSAGRPSACPTRARRKDRTNYKITITESLRFQGIAAGLFFPLVIRRLLV